jgi:hypothetical protein
MSGEKMSAKGLNYDESKLRKHDGISPRAPDKSEKTQEIP